MIESRFYAVLEGSVTIQLIILFQFWLVGYKYNDFRFEKLCYTEYNEGNLVFIYKILEFNLICSIKN